MARYFDQGIRGGRAAVGGGPYTVFCRGNESCGERAAVGGGPYTVLYR